MPMLIPFIPLIAAGLGGAASIAGSAIASGSKKTTSTTTPTLSPELQAAQDSTLGDLSGIQKNPMGGLAPIQQAAQDSINRSYSTMPNTATQKLAARGFGASGQVGDAVYDTEGSRLGAQSGLYGQMAQLSSQRQLSADQIMQSMIHGGQGSETVGTSPNQSLAGGLLSGGNALSNLGVLTTLAQMLKGGGASGGGGNIGGVSGPGISIGDVLGQGAKGVSNSSISYPMDESGWGN